MSFVYDKPSRSILGKAPVKFGGEEIGLLEGMSYGYDMQRVRNSDAALYLFSEIMDPVIEAIKERTGERFVPPDHFIGAQDAGPGGNGNGESLMIAEANKIFDHIQANKDIYPEYQGLSFARVQEMAKEKALAILGEQESLSAKTTFMGAVGEFVGEIGGSLADRNIQELSIMAGPAFFTAGGATTLARTMLAEGALSAGTEAIIQSGVKEWYDELGLKYGVGEFAANVAAAGIVGGVIPGIPAGYILTRNQIKKGIDVFSKNGNIDAADARVVVDALDDEARLTTKPPDDVVSETEYSQSAHASRIERATNDIVNGRLPEQSNSMDTATVPRQVADVAEVEDVDLEPILKQFDDGDVIPDEIGEDQIVNKTISDIRAEIADYDNTVNILKACTL